MRHKIRPIDHLLHYFHIGERCNCVMHYEEEVWSIRGIKALFWPWSGTGTGCQQRSYKNGDNKTMNVYGTMVFLCEFCAEHHMEANQDYIESHGKALEQILRNPADREVFMRNRDKWEHLQQ